MYDPLTTDVIEIETVDGKILRWERDKFPVTYEGVTIDWSYFLPKIMELAWDNGHAYCITRPGIKPYDYYNYEQGNA